MPTRPFLGTFLLVYLLAGSAFAQSEALKAEVANKTLLQKMKKSSLPNIGPEDMATRLVTDAPIREEEYLLGPGDILVVHLGSPIQAMVTPEGMVMLPEVTPVLVGGFSLAESKMRLKQALKPHYDTSKVFITLAAANNFKVHIAGEVGNPGLKAVNSFTRVEEVLAMAGGFTRYAVRDHVIILRSDGTRHEADLSEFYRTFKDADNPFLRFGDKVVVEAVDFSKPYCTLKIGGEFHYHQVRGEHNLKDIFLQASTYAQNNPPSHSRVAGKGNADLLLGPSELQTYRPVAGDTIEYMKNVDFVFVGGAVARPSMYEYIPNFEVGDYLYQAGITPQSSDATKYQIFREARLAGPDEIRKTGVRPGDRIYLDRSKVDVTRDYLGIFVSLASILISSATLYYTYNATR